MIPIPFHVDSKVCDSKEVQSAVQKKWRVENGEVTERRKDWDILSYVESRLAVHDDKCGVIVTQRVRVVLAVMSRIGPGLSRNGGWMRVYLSTSLNQIRIRAALLLRVSVSAALPCDMVSRSAQE
eukprot:scaffold19434_cov121-Skeletonema_dohrnii-CCMP3373.AAC.9